MRTWRNLACPTNPGTGVPTQGQVLAFNDLFSVKLNDAIKALVNPASVPPDQVVYDTYMSAFPISWRNKVIEWMNKKPRAMTIDKVKEKILEMARISDQSDQIAYTRVEDALTTSSRNIPTSTIVKPTANAVSEKAGSNLSSNDERPLHRPNNRQNRGPKPWNQNRESAIVTQLKEMQSNSNNVTQEMQNKINNLEGTI